MTAAVQDRVVRLVPIPTGITAPGPDREVHDLAADPTAERSARLQAAWDAHPAGRALRERPPAPVGSPAPPAVHRPAVHLTLVGPPPVRRGRLSRRLRTGSAFVASWAAGLGAVAATGTAQHVLEAVAVGTVLAAAVDRRLARTGRRD
jgi:hypothetical protein